MILQTKTNSIFAVLVMASAGLLLFSFPVHVSAESEALPEEALVDLVKPSVVRIAEHVTGTAKIPEVKVDIRKRLVAVVPDKFTEVPVDEYLSGSGFVIHSDGYIATNAHVVSQETVKQSLASESALSAMFENALFLSDQELNEFINSDEGERFSHEVLRYVIDHGTFDLKNEVVVLRPGSEKGRIADLMTEGYPAEIISVNDRFLENERDVAIIRINETGLPALRIGQSGSLAVGKKAFIFGFPATAEANRNDQAEATFTSGVVSAIKQSSDRSFQIFQTDAKVSEGSSGGPLLNDAGEAVGVITFQTSGLGQTSGDNFAFALPIDIVQAAAGDARIDTEEGIYGRNFRPGYVEFSAKRCENAEGFLAAAASGTNSGFGASNRLKSYIDRCAELRQSGMSVDSRWDKLRVAAGSPSNLFLYLFGGVLFLSGMFGAALFWMLRQVRREEREIEALGERLQADEVRIRAYRDGHAPWVKPADPSAGERKKIV
jgi:S1-C subfamily serine protease